MFLRQREQPSSQALILALLNLFFRPSQRSREPLVVEWFPSNDSHYIQLAGAQMVHQRPVAIIPFRDFGASFDLTHEVAIADDWMQLEPGTVVIVHRPGAVARGQERFEVVSKVLHTHFGTPYLEDDDVQAFRVGPDSPDERAPTP